MSMTWRATFSDDVAGNHCLALGRDEASEASRGNGGNGEAHSWGVRRRHSSKDADGVHAPAPGCAGCRDMEANRPGRDECRGVGAD
jgi:hypothetical protein